MFTRILVGFDGSEHAERALRTAIALAQDGAIKGQVTAMSVQHTFTTYGMIQPIGMIQPFGIANMDDDKLLSDEADGIRGRVEQIASEAQAKVDVQIQMGDVANEICAFAKENHFDLIVMGSRGHGTMVELAIGSVSHKVVQHAQVPVLIVK